MKNRNSNYEALKIISMLMIIMGHIIQHGQVINTSSNLVRLFFMFIFSILIVHVNCFVLITGYFQSQSKFKLKKIFLLNFKAWFYRVLILILFLMFSGKVFSRMEIFYNIFPFPLIETEAWFFKIYFILYLISPFLNLLISKLSKIQFKKLLILLLFLFSIMPTITGELFFFNKNGYSIENFILLYFIGAYLKMYPIENIQILKDKSIFQKRIIYFSTFVCFFILNFLVYVIGLFVSKYSLSVGTLITSRLLAYDNPLVISGAISFFLLFGTFNLKNNLINEIAQYTFGIYLIHDNYLIRSILYNFLGFGSKEYHFSILINIVCFTIIIFLLCMVIDYFVTIIVKKVLDNKYMDKVKNKFYNWYGGLRWIE